jgi:hypothetical protein
MNKKFVILVLVILVLTSFSTITFVSPQASGSPPTTGDKNFVNASFSTSYTQVQTGSNPSFSINIPSSGSIKAKANATGSTGGTATSNVVNQTINPEAIPASPSSMNTSNIHPLTTTTGYVYFNETGLPSGTSWSVLYNSLNLSSTTTSIKFSETVDIEYSYTVHNSNVGGKIYTPSPSSGSARAPSSVGITFNYVALTASASASHNPSDVGQNVNYTFVVNGGVPPYTIQYQFGVGGDIFSLNQGQMYVDYIWLSSGTQYAYFKVQDSASPSDWYNFTFTQTVDPSLSVSVSSSSKNPIDSGQSVTFTATASGGSGSYSTYDFYVNGVSEQSGSSNTYTTTSLAVGTDSITVTVTDSNGYTSPQSPAYSETVNSDPTVTISSSNNPVDVNIAVTFTANPSGGSGTYSSYAWYVSSAQQSSTSSTMSYTFTSSGSYTVEVIVTDSLNFKAYYNYSETANPLLTVSLGVNLNPIDVNVQAAWSASASGGDGSYTYYFYLNGVLQSSSGSVFYYTASSSGSYEVYVKVVDSEGEVAYYDNVTETVNPAVQAYISSNVNPASISQTFTLTANAYDGTSSYYYQWYTGTAGSGSAISGATSSTYSTSESSAGTYDFYVVVTDSGGGSITSATFQETVASVSVYITPSRSPSDQNQKVFFNATESGGSGTIYYAFYLQGTLEVNSTSPSWSTVFTSTGTYNVTVWVYATSGGSAHAINSQVVNTDPTISVSSSQITTDVGLTVTFSSSPSGGTTPYTYSWGGGTVSGSSRNITWSFTTSGNFTVSITLTDSAGYQVTASLTETVHSDPTATISSSSNPATVGYSFTLTATAALGTSPYSYQWYYNGTLISGATASTYTTSQSLPGKYNYTVKITDNAGYSVTSSKFVETVQVHITVTLTSSLNPSIAGQKVYFNVSASGGVAPYTYTFYIEIVNMSLPEQVITYSITQHQAASGVYYNSSKMFINYTTPFSSFAFSQVNYRFSISNLTLTNPTAPVDTFNLINYTFNTFALYRHTTTYSAIAYQNTSSTTVNATFATSEFVKGILKWQYSPVEYSFITKNTVISATASIPSPATMTLLSLSINGIFAGQVSGNGGNSITMSYNLSQYFKTHILSAITVQWTGQSSIGTQAITLYYSSTTHPVASSHSIIIYQSANATYQYPINLAESAPSSSHVTQSEQINEAMEWVALGPEAATKYSITLSGVPSGTGMYQQSLKIDPATYGINTAGSNVLFYDGSNNTELYAWLESINSTSALYWVKNYNASSTINMFVYPSGDNFFSSTGYLNNVSGQNVFLHWQSFAGLSSLPSGWIQTGGTIAFGTNYLSFSSSYHNALLMSPWVSADDFAYGSKDLITGTGIVANGSSNFLSWISTSQTSWVNFYGALLDANSSDFYYYQNGAGATQSGLIGYTGSWYDSLIEYSGSAASLVENWQDVVTGLSIPSTIPNQYPGFLVNDGTLSIQYAFIALIGTSGMPTFTIGSGSSYYSISFHESGLPSGTEWWANVTGQSSVSSTSTYVNLTNPLPNGTYYYNVSTINEKYFPTPKSSSIVIDGANVSVSIVFSNYFITFTESGLTSGTWYVNVSTTSQSFSEPYGTTTISFSEPNGTYHFVITASLVTASPSPASGNITVNGATVWVNITFTIEPYYLQKISITNTTILAGLNTADSNFLISTSSEVLLYTLITYVSPTELNISVRTPSGTTTLEIQEYEKFQSFITPTGYLQNVSTSFWTNITIPSTMPTYTFGTGTLWMASIVPQEIGGMTGTNGGQGVYNNSLDWNTYSYQIAVAPNANYITVLFNSTWIFLNTGTTLGTYIALTNSTYDFVTFYDVHGYSFITVTFVEQSTSYADFSINYYPTSAVLNEFGINLQYNDFLTYVNGNYSSSSLVPAQMGHTYNIKTYDKPYNQLISNINYSVNYPDSQVSIPINIYPITVENLNSSYAIGLVVSAPGTIAQSQNGTFLTPYDTIDEWLPEGKYYFNYTYVNFNYTVEGTMSRLVNISGPSFQLINGVTLTQIQFTQQKNAQNISNLVEAVNITFLNSNSNILNQTLKINVNLQDFNTSVKNLYAQILNNVTFLKSIVTNSTATMTDKMNFINSSLKYMDASVVAQLIYDLSAIQNMNSTVTLQNIQIMKELSTIGNQSESQYVALETTLFQATGSMRPLSYQFISQNGTYSNGIYNLPVVVLSWQDTTEPTPVTISLLRNLTVEYIQGSSSGIPVHFTAASISQHGFMLRLSISVAQLKEIDSGSAKLLLNSNFNGTNGAGIVTSMPYTVPTTLYSFLSGYAVYFESYQGLTILMTILGLVLALMSVSIDVRSIRKMNNGGRR